MGWLKLSVRRTVVPFVKSNLFLEYVEEIYQIFLEAMNTTSCLGDAVKELTAITPLPMNTMLDKETRESALDSRQKRRKTMVVKNAPPTTRCKYI